MSADFIRRQVLVGLCCIIISGTGPFAPCKNFAVFKSHCKHFFHKRICDENIFAKK